eukprot:Skav227790  [mRNA]  locus=scaffold948:25195:26085:+ [translate_table: standard]
MPEHGGLRREQRPRHATIVFITVTCLATSCSRSSCFSFAKGTSKSCQAAALGPDPDNETLKALDRALPKYMLKASGWNDQLAMKRWTETLQWRCEIDDDKVITKPNPLFFRIFPHYPTYLHLEDRAGRLTYWEILGQLDPEALRREGLTPSMITENYIWQTLFTWDVWLQRDDAAEGTIIVDMEGFRFSKLTLGTIHMFSRTSAIIQRHFPEREHIVIVVNAPAWWGRIYDLFSPLFSEKQRRKLRVCVDEKTSSETLLEFIDAKHLPVKYGGSSGPLGSAPADVLRQRYASKGAS